MAGTSGSLRVDLLSGEWEALGKAGAPTGATGRLPKGDGPYYLIMLTNAVKAVGGRDVRLAFTEGDTAPTGVERGVTWQDDRGRVIGVLMPRRGKD